MLGFVLPIYNLRLFYFELQSNNDASWQRRASGIADFFLGRGLRRALRFKCGVWTYPAWPADACEGELLGRRRSRR